MKKRKRATIVRGTQPPIPRWSFRVAVTDDDGRERHVLIEIEARSWFDARERVCTVAHQHGQFLRIVDCFALP